MASISIKINEAAVKQKVYKAIEIKGGPIAKKRAYQLFKRAYNAMLKEFDQHPITAEIKAGPRAINSSNTLDGYGNLYSFIGFEAGADPITPLRELLEIGTTFKQTVFRNNTWYFKISTPSKIVIADVTDMPWESGASWAEGIESGISNLSHYLFKKSNASRSGYGLQEKAWEINEDLVFHRTKYLTEIFTNFRNRINNSKTNESII